MFSGVFRTYNLDNNLRVSFDGGFVIVTLKEHSGLAIY